MQPAGELSAPGEASNLVIHSTVETAGSSGHKPLASTGTDGSAASAAARTCAPAASNPLSAAGRSSPEHPAHRSTNSGWMRSLHRHPPDS